MANLPDKTVVSFSEDRKVTFYNKYGEIVGELDFSTDIVSFEGKIADSADSFFKMLQNAINPFFNTGE